MNLLTPIDPDLLYPDSDGKPMAENTEQYRWLVMIKENLEILYADQERVFIAGDLLWYPVPSRRVTFPVAPDVMVIFGRPKGRRGSYKQWEEDNISPQVVFEILSPSNTDDEMEQKLRFYERYGVEEYYVYDPETDHLEGWIRQGQGLNPIDQVNDWISPRLGIRFDHSGSELAIYRPDGRRFMTSVELEQQLNQERQQRERAEQQLTQAQQQTTQAQQQATQERQRANQLAARLRALGVDPDAE